jgi:DNA-binding CsgD family transcriptional regulator
MTTDLTARQKEILDLWLSGLNYRQVSETAGISVGTLNPHLKQIARKLGTTKIGREALGRAAAAAKESATPA